MRVEQMKNSQFAVKTVICKSSTMTLKNVLVTFYKMNCMLTIRYGKRKENPTPKSSW